MRSRWVVILSDAVTIIPRERTHQERTLPANEIWFAKVTQKCHVPRYYHGPASQGISMSILAQTPRLR